VQGRLQFNRLIAPGVRGLVVVSSLMKTEENGVVDADDVLAGKTRTRPCTKSVRAAILLELHF
jgi:hypothetical protein